MKKTLLYFLLCFSINGFAQDWAPFKTTDSIRHFVALNTSGYKPIQSVSVDSSFADSSGLSLFFEKGFSLLKLYARSTGASEDIIKGRILGDQIHFYQDSLLISTVDSFGFQLIFPFSYSIGQTFTFATSLNHNISAVCDSLYSDSINGQTDSIALIRLTVYDQNATVDSTHHFNCTYKISKNFGLIRTPDFTSLDSLHYYQPYFGLKEKLRCNKTFGLTVGDEYHYTRDTNNYLTSNQSIFYSSYGYKVYITADTIIGSVRTVSFTEHSGSGFPGLGYRGNRQLISSFTYDTSGYCHIAKSAIIHDSLLNWSQQFNNVPLPIYWIEDSKPVFKLGKTREFSSEVINYSAQGLGWPPVIDSIFYSPFYTLSYLNNIGLTDESYQNGYGGNGSSSTSKSLVYFRKGNQTWGTPLNLSVGLKEVSQMGSLKLYPNPVLNQLRMETEEVIKAVLVSDLNGKVVEVNLTNNMVDVSNFSSGLYFIQVETEEGIWRNKFVKR